MNDQPNILLYMLEGLGPWKWMIIGVLLLVLEMLTGSMFLLWPAIAAVIVGVALFILPIGWEMQLVLFAIVSALGLFWGEKYLRPRLSNDSAADDLNDRSSRMVGTRVSAIGDFKLGKGRVKVDDTEWAASIEAGDPKAGDELRILTVSGASVTVEFV